MFSIIGPDQNQGPVCGFSGYFCCYDERWGTSGSCFRISFIYWNRNANMSTSSRFRSRIKPGLDPSPGGRHRLLVPEQSSCSRFIPSAPPDPNRIRTGDGEHWETPSFLFLWGELPPGERNYSAQKNKGVKTVPLISAGPGPLVEVRLGWKREGRTEGMTELLHRGGGGNVFTSCSSTNWKRNRKQEFSSGKKFWFWPRRGHSPGCGTSERFLSLVSEHEPRLSSRSNTHVGWNIPAFISGGSGGSGSQRIKTQHSEHSIRSIKYQDSDNQDRLSAQGSDLCPFYLNSCIGAVLPGGSGTPGCSDRTSRSSSLCGSGEARWWLLPGWLQQVSVPTKTLNNILTRI